ncbi:MAG TPA: class I SAM-dependent methyltransferase [Steroidobacteraceae bacterium]|nr:class I SAM-dependent methyltransferase [Steroidobacteraceae bacterium]
MLPKRSIGAEIGVHVGDFSQLILEYVRPKELHLIDPWEHQGAATHERALFGGVAGDQATMDARYGGVRARFDRQIRAGSMVVHRACSGPTLAQFPDEYLDWIYIDGNHLYEGVMEDLELSLKKVKSGGFITGDDYGRKGWWDDGVRKAVDEFAAQKRADLLVTRNFQFIFRRF